MKRCFASLVATIGLAAVVALVGTSPAAADGPTSPLYDCTITPEAPGGLSELDDIPVPIDVTDERDPVAPGATIAYDVNLDLPNIGENPGLGLIGIEGLDVDLPRPDDLASVAAQLGGAPNPPLSTWSATSDADSLTVRFQGPAYPNNNTNLLIRLQANGDFVYPFNPGTDLVVPPTVDFTATTTAAQAGTTVEWTAPTLTAELVILGNDHDLECNPQDPSTVIVATDVCDEVSFSDVPASSPFYCDIQWMDEQGISTGFAGGTYRPGAPVTRQAMSAFMFRLALAEFADPPEATFTDVATDHPFFTEIEWMNAEAITTGFPGNTFRPGANVTRQAMSAFMFRLAEAELADPPVATFTDVATDHPFFTEIEWMAATGITTGFPGNTYRPGADVTRQAMSAFMHRLALLEA